MKKRWIPLLAASGILAIVVPVWIFWSGTTDSSHILEVSGRIEGDQTAIGAKIGGRIVQLPIREGQELETGQLIAQLSSEQATAQLDQAEHELHTNREELQQAVDRISVMKLQVDASETAVRLAEEESQAKIAEASAALNATEARLNQARAERVRAEKDYTRYKELFEKGSVSAREFDHSKAAYDAARAAEEAATQQISQAQQTLSLTKTSAITIDLRKKELAQANERLKETESAVEAARARVQVAEAQRDLANATVKDTRVLAPFSGTVLRKLVAEGEVVAAGTPLVTFVDLSNLHVKVYVPETDIGKVKLGDPARVYIDAYPKRYFEATVSEVSQQAEFTPRDIHMKDERVNLVFSMKLALRNPEGILKPGMPADARIMWQDNASWGDGLE